MLDVIVQGADVIDGTGSPRRQADIGIQDGRITAIGTIAEAAKQTFDADGLVVAPGVVDIHTHYDAQVFWDPAFTPSPFHGVTTVIGGNCGFTIAPVEASEVDYLTRMLARVEGMPLEALIAGVPYDWRSFGDYLNRIDNTLTINAGFLVGHSAIRRVAMGEAAVGNAATPEQLEAMRRLLSDSLAAGGLGFSSSHAATHNDANGDPVPSRSATAEELIALAKVTGEHPGTTLEFIPVAGGFDESHISLMTEMSLAANRPLNWNVLVPTAARAEAAWAMLEASDYATERGAKVLALTLPDVMRIHLTLKAGFLFDALPNWGKPMALPVPEKMALLSQPEERKRLYESSISPEAGVMRGFARWDRMTIVETFSPTNAGLAGRLVGEIAAERGQEPFDTFCEISLADELQTVFMPPIHGDDQESWELRRDVWRDPRTIVGASDAGAHLDMLSTFNFSTSMLKECRERNLIPLEEAIHYLTDQPARLYGLRDRGRIAEGWYADLMIFDENQIGPGPVTWRNDLPAGAGRLYGEAVGIEHVFANGVEVVRRNELTGNNAGTLLRSGRDTETVTAA